MQIQSGREVAVLWSGAILLFLATAWASTALTPTGSATGPTASYYVGLVGLLAIGVALALTWAWVRRAGPTSPTVRTLLQVLLGAGAVLWLAAMVFPFL